MLRLLSLCFDTSKALNSSSKGAHLGRYGQNVEGWPPRLDNFVRRTSTEYSVARCYILIGQM
jgi:hypothetical protein